MECFSYSQFPANVYVALYMNVSNSSALRQRIVKASTSYGEQGTLERESVNFAFIDPRLITSLLHLQTAIYQAILADSQRYLRTKTIHSEVLWVLNPTNNITEALRRYGVSDTSTALLVVRITSNNIEDIQGRMDSIVEGSIAPLSTLEHLTDWSMIKKYHKLGTELENFNSGQGSVFEQVTLENIVVSSVAMKCVMA